MKFNIPFFFLLSLVLLRSYLRSLCQTQDHKDLWLFLSKNVPVLALIISPTINFCVWSGVGPQLLSSLLIYSLIHYLGACFLISTYLWIPEISFSYLLLISFHVVREYTCMSSIFINLSRFILWPSIWSIVENVPRVLNKDAHSAFVEWSVS